MSRTLSTALDAIRFLAAAWVALAHLRNSHTYEGPFQHLLPSSGHDAVMVFFVLSGYVMAYARDRRPTLRNYLAARLGRLHSVALPALIVSAALWIAVGMPRPSEELFQILASAAFACEIWTMECTPFANDPYWSINFEFWFYVIFAASFLRGYLSAALVGAAMLLLAGPKIAIMFVVWLLGAFTFMVTKRARIPLPLALLLLLAAILAYILLKTTGAQTEIFRASRLVAEGLLFDRGGRAQLFLWDYTVGVLFSISILAINSIPLVFPALLGRVVALLASITFSLYLVHMPVYFIAVRIPGFDRASSVHAVLVLLGLAAAVGVFGWAFERRKGAVARFYLRLFDFFSPAAGARSERPARQRGDAAGEDIALGGRKG